MKTDLHLKCLSLLRADDLLVLLDVPAEQVVKVVVRELPMQKRSLDTLFRIRSPQGQEYLHLLEWQGYPDPSVLWRVLSYLGLVAQDAPHITIIGTIVYLKPSDDAGDTLTMSVDGQVLHQWSFRCIRLWEQDAAAALATGNLALTTLSPLMLGADTTLVEQAVQQVLQTAPPAQQSDLLAILGVFAAPIVEPARFVNLVTKEYLMRSELIDYLAKDLIAEQETKWQARIAEIEARLEAERQTREAERQTREAERQILEARLEAERQTREAERQMLAAEREGWLQVEREMRAHMQAAQLPNERETLASMMSLRFPDAPLRLTNLIRKITDVSRLQALCADLPEVPDLATLEQQLRDAAG